MENLRIMKDYENLAKMCKASHSKLEVAASILFVEDVRNEIRNFIQSALLYFKSYFCWASIKINEKDVKIEDYSRKNFTVLTKEILNLSNSVLGDYKTYLSYKNNDEYFSFGKIYFEEVFLPVATQ